MRILFLAAIVPPLFLMYKIYEADKIEKEPTGLLVRIFIRGAISTVLAMAFETVGTIIIAYIGISDTSLLGLILMNFIVVAVSEEFVKRWAMKGPTWKNPEFNYLFDGVVYGVAATLGFAALENVMYVFDFGFGVGVFRAVTSIPLHCICGVYMGYFYGRAKYFEHRGLIGQQQTSMRLSLLVPVLIHGFYDFAASINNDVFTIVFLVFVIVMEIYSIRKVKQYSKEDAPVADTTYFYREDGPSAYTRVGSDGNVRLDVDSNFGKPKDQ